MLGSDSQVDGLPLLGPLGHLVRGEFSHVPLLPSGAFDAYQGLGGGDFVGPDDLRLQQLHNVADTENASAVAQVRQTLSRRGIGDTHVYGRAKTPGSMWGKLWETPGQTVGGMKDLSGMRVDVDVNQPGFAQHRQIQQALAEDLGTVFEPKGDYVNNPNKWGYTGRIHGEVPGGSLPGHELQIGSKDLSQFIDQKVQAPSGQTRSIHDMTAYKGDLYKYKISDELGAQYPELMKKIGANDAAGNTVAQNAGLADELRTFRDNVQAGLPETLPTGTSPQVSKLTRLKQVGGKGLGALGVVGGGLQVAGAVDSMANGGDQVEGSLDIGEGGSNMAAGGAMLLGRAALGTTLGGVAATVDGVGDLYKGARDGNKEQMALGGAKSVAGGLMLAGAATANPVLIAAGAITYGGAMIYENKEVIAKYGGQAVDWLGDRANEGVESLKSGASAAVGAANDVGKWAGNKVNEGVKLVSGAVGETKEVIGEGAKWLGNKATGAWDAAKGAGGTIAGWLGW